MNVEWSNDSVKIATLLTFETLNWEYTFTTDVLIAIRDELSLVCSGAPGAPYVSGHDNFGTRHFGTYSIWYIVTLEHAKFGTWSLRGMSYRDITIQDCTTALFQDTMSRQFAGKIGSSANSPLIRYYSLRFATASERTAT